VADRLASRSILLIPFAARRLRAVTHMDVDDDGIEAAIEVLAAAVD
jgi:hypothetical protein